MSLFIAGKINHVWFLIENIRSMNKRGKFKALVSMPGSDNKTLFEGVSMSPLLANCIAKDGTITLNFGSKACPELTVDQDGTIHGLTSSKHAPFSLEKILKSKLNGFQSKAIVMRYRGRGSKSESPVIRVQQ